MKKIFWVGGFTIVFLSACSSDPNKPYSDTTTAGIVTIAADETLQPLVDVEKDTFMGLYRYSNLKINYKSETESFNDFLADSAKVIFSSRRLLAKEESFFKSRNLFPVTTKVAIDAIALVVNKGNRDTLLKVTQLKEILTGKIKSWKQLNSSSNLGEIALVFDNNGSSNVRYLKDSILFGGAFSENCFAVNSNEQVMDYVEKHPNAIGIIGVAWISDKDDPQGQKFLSRVAVMEIAVKDDAIFPEDYFKPYQAYIALKQYPFVREVYMINREGRTGLGTGFVSFVAGDKGQRVVRLAGLLPATMPVRIIDNNQ